jgi:mono/diheme cytochrome c family protein
MRIMQADKRSFWLLLSVMGALFFMQTQTAWALPAFSRVYQTSCITCHDSPPRLNGVGEAFLLNGYKFPDDEVKNKLKPLPLGDDAYQ